MRQAINEIKKEFYKYWQFWLVAELVTQRDKSKQCAEVKRISRPGWTRHGVIGTFRYSRKNLSFNFNFWKKVRFFWAKNTCHLK